MYKKLIAITILGLYFLVLAVAITNGPLASFQSMILGLIGLIVLTSVISSIAKKIKLLDTANEERKSHIGSIPLIGGLVIFVSIIYGTFVFGVDPFYRIITISLIPILIIGTIDGIEYIKTPVSIRLIAQILASWIIILFTDIYLRDLGDLFGQGTIFLNELGIPFTIFAVVGICNAFNMLDGKDGLTGSVSVVIISSLLLLLYVNNILYNWGLILISSILIFLAFNLSLFGNKKKIFLGDHGSTGLGHIIAWNLIYLSQEKDLITPVSALFFIFFPLTDTLLTMFKRARSSKSIFHPDRKHMHHFLSDIGFSDRAILIIIIVVSIIAGCIAVASNFLNVQEYYVLYGYITALVFMGILGYSKPTKD
ncbi:MAG: undecaprenyl/decaprenyl-phosphate alpha-N-acetylglucosaminyl 1-phosphate transferase [Pelagibacterales bacterium]|nr:undecaprenyl/decaprenyl-phosphate alpha-N-acetylglucosaminyl 1-phosphate transferase [Pelagibacterales bacterium]